MYDSAIDTFVNNDLDIWALNLKTFSAVPTHMMNFWAKFHWNHSTRYRGITSHEIGISGQQMAGWWRRHITGYYIHICAFVCFLFPLSRLKQNMFSGVLSRGVGVRILVQSRSQESLIWRRLRLQALSVLSGLVCNFVAVCLTSVQFILQL